MPTNTSEILRKYVVKEQFFFVLKGQALFYIHEDLEILNPSESILVSPKYPILLPTKVVHP